MIHKREVIIISEKFEQIKTIAEKNPQLLAYGIGASNKLNAIANTIRKAEANYINQKIKEELGEIDLDRETKLSNAPLTELIMDVGCSDVPQPDISSLKKRIKYCKNPMEKKSLQQELNYLYREQKRRKS